MLEWWNKYVGIPYKDSGRDRDGADCAGLVCLVYRDELGRDVDQDLGFYDALDKDQATELLGVATSAQWEQVQEPQDFDAVLLLIHGEPCHVGIICDGGKSVLNVRAKVNAVIEPLDGIWASRIDSYWRLRA